MTQKLKSLGFNSAHLQLLTVAFVVVGGLIFVKSGLSVRALFVHADNEKPPVTYDSVRNQIVSESSQQADPAADAEAEKQLALLDRQLDSGQVLGESIGVGTIPNVEQVFSRSLLDQIQVKTTDTSKQSISKYAEQVAGVETQDGAVILLGSLNSDDPTVLNQTKQSSDVVVQGLSTLIVPSELADYHRYKMLYYKSLATMADYFAKNDLNTDFQNNSKVLFSLTEKIEQIKTDIYNKYQVTL
jgi:hypothetical protein